MTLKSLQDRGRHSEQKVQLSAPILTETDPWTSERAPDSDRQCAVGSSQSATARHYFDVYRSQGFHA